MINDFFNLIFPSVCSACGLPLLKVENEICSSCLFTLPRTNFHLLKDNPIEKIFWGRVEIQQASALYFYEKKGKVQRLIHQLKYQGKTEVGIVLGELFANELKRQYRFNDFDFIVPVPLAKQKEKLRGYNQVDYFAQGLSNIFNIPIVKDALIKESFDVSQTLKTRYKRWENVSNSFALKEDQLLYNKRVLLVDDVITTGATIEACARPLININCNVSVLALAFSK